MLQSSCEWFHWLMWYAPHTPVCKVLKKTDDYLASRVDPAAEEDSFLKTVQSKLYLKAARHKLIVVEDGELPTCFHLTSADMVWPSQSLLQVGSAGRRKSVYFCSSRLLVLVDFPIHSHFSMIHDMEPFTTRISLLLNQFLVLTSCNKFMIHC